MRTICCPLFKQTHKIAIDSVDDVTLTLAASTILAVASASILAAPINFRLWSSLLAPSASVLNKLTSPEVV